MSGKGGQTKSKVEIPKELREGARQALDMVNQIGKIGYVPYRGPDVAAFNPQQMAAFQGGQQASSAFGVGSPFVAGAGLPQTVTTPNGVTGYSSAPGYDAAVGQIDPAQLQAIMSIFNKGPVAPAGAAGAKPWWKK